MIHWKWSSFEELSTSELYEILKARQAVFAVEQSCVYQDIDDLDQFAWHLCGRKSENLSGAVCAYLRVVFPNKKYPEPSIGRVLTASSSRGFGAGKALMKEAIRQTELEYPDTDIRISAQLYLEKFYSSFGFERSSENYDEDGIPHLEMLRK